VKNQTYDICKQAVQQNGYALHYASEERKADRDVVLAAVKQDGTALEFASERLRADRDVVLAAVRKSGSEALYHASEDLKTDREVILAAVRQNGLTLNFASAVLRADKEVVFTSFIYGSGEYLRIVSDELKNDYVNYYDQYEAYLNNEFNRIKSNYKYIDGKYIEFTTWTLTERYI
jgi:hypothetical protein